MGHFNFNEFILIMEHGYNASFMSSKGFMSDIVTTKLWNFMR